MKSRLTTTSMNIIEAYIKFAGLQDDPKGLLFRTVAGKTSRLTTLPLSVGTVNEGTSAGL